MSLASKHYYLFNIRIWSVIVEMHEQESDELEESESDDEPSGSTSVYIQQPLEAPPAFGFTPFTPHWVEYEEE